jgi:lipoate-protein ligase A
LILEAADKASYESFGISLIEADHLYPITRYAKRLLSEGCDYVLLPYCAKPPSCEYRKREGCAKCGGCSFGEMYELAESIGLKPVTIENFEHLIETLKIMKNRGARGYIGCCCNAFYCKHRDDLEKAGVPGIIVDIDDQTCYDLGKIEDAYNGNFEGQTQLKVELLSKLLNWVGRKRIPHNVVEKCATHMS